MLRVSATYAYCNDSWRCACAYANLKHSNVSWLLCRHARVILNHWGAPHLRAQIILPPEHHHIQTTHNEHTLLSSRPMVCLDWQKTKGLARVHTGPVQACLPNQLLNGPHHFTANTVRKRHVLNKTLACREQEQHTPSNQPGHSRRYCRCLVPHRHFKKPLWVHVCFTAFLEK